MNGRAIDLSIFLSCTVTIQFSVFVMNGRAIVSWLFFVLIFDIVKEVLNATIVF